MDLSDSERASLDREIRNNLRMCQDVESGSLLCCSLVLFIGC